jgi:hypothetical protein
MILGILMISLVLRASLFGFRLFWDLVYAVVFVGFMNIWVVRDYVWCEGGVLGVSGHF